MGSCNQQDVLAKDYVVPDENLTARSVDDAVRQANSISDMYTGYIAVNNGGV
jgi:hypothetical protein